MSANSAHAAPGDKPPPTAYVPTAEKGAASGVATLDVQSKIPAAQLPDLSATILSQLVVRGPVDVTDEGVVLDGVTDNVTSFQAAANKARDEGRALYIPAGDLYWAGQVNIYTDLKCEAIVRFKTNVPSSLRIARTAAPVVLRPGTLGGLTAGSSQLTGAGTAAGTLVLESTEHLIERENGVGQYYLKCEVAQLGKAGVIAPALDETMSSAQTTGTLYPDEPALVVDGLRATLDGATLAANPYWVGVHRSNVTFNDLSLVNNTVLKPTIGVDVRYAANVTFNRPVIHGFDEDGAGYGLATFYTAFTRITDAGITRCRHTVSGRFNKKVIYDGGYYEGGLDTHWGSGHTMRNLTSVVVPGGWHFAVAGKDFTIENCDLVGGRKILAIRGDTPEVTGTIKLTDSTWAPTVGSGAATMVAHGSLHAGFFNYGRTIRGVDQAIIRNVRITKSAGLVYALELDARGYPQDYWADIDIQNIQFDASTHSFTAASLDPNFSQYTTATRGMTIRVRGIDFSRAANAVDSIFVFNTGDLPPAAIPGIDLTVQDCRGVMIKVPERGMRRVRVLDCVVKRLFRSAISAAPAIEEYILSGNTLDATAFNGSFRIDFRANIWSGANTSASLTMDTRVKSYTGNYALKGASGHPTRAEGYKDTGVYQ